MRQSTQSADGRLRNVAIRPSVRIRKTTAPEVPRQRRPGPTLIWKIFGFVCVFSITSSLLTTFNLTPDPKRKFADTLPNEISNTRQFVPIRPNMDTPLKPPPEIIVPAPPLLSCEAHGGPIQSIAEEMIYWKDIPTDMQYISPFKDLETEKFLTFEPDDAGWNNVRMGLETVLIMAWAMGRTLVLPPEQSFYLMQNVEFSDFYHLDSLSAKFPGLEIITMEKFLSTEAMAGKFWRKSSGMSMLPPQNRVIWDNQDLNPLWSYLREAGRVLSFDPNTRLAAFPIKTGQDGVKEMQTVLTNILEQTDGRVLPHPHHFYDHPTPVDFPAIERLREAMADRTELWYYDEKLQNEHLLHIELDHNKGSRLLTHFYTFLFFEDWKADLWAKRFIRDHIRYRDEIMCAAARVVDAIRDRARSRNPDSNPSGEFDTIHVRRTDFQVQFKATKHDGDAIYNSMKDEIEEGSTVYVATDERDRNFFKPLAAAYDLCFIEDFQHLFLDLNTNYYGMVDQLIASRGRVFFGIFYSTFTGYVNRLRGYYSLKEKSDGYLDGLIRSYNYVPNYAKNEMRRYKSVRAPFYMREYPVSWRDIDKGVGELNDKKKTLILS